MPCDIGKKKKLHKWWRSVSKRLEDLVTCENRDDTFTVSAQAQGADVLPMKHEVICDNRLLSNQQSLFISLSFSDSHFNPKVYT